MSENRKISYGRQTIEQCDIDAVVDVLKSDYLTTGPKLKEFEQNVAAYHGAKYAVAFANGTAALHGAYTAAGVVKGDEIITSPITFAASANGAIYCGAIPKFVDIDLETNCMDLKALEFAITDKTRVITPVSLAGYPVDLKSVREIADRYNCMVIHDAAHAIGSRRGGTFGMEYADMAILSFHPVKHIATGEGGMVLTNSEELYKALMLFRSHGITKNPTLMTENHGPWYYEMVSLGYNYRMTDIQAALGISQFNRITENIKQRNEVAKAYSEAFKDNKKLILPPNLGFDVVDDAEAENVHAYHLFTLRLKNPDDRKEFYTYLHERGILAQIHYIPVHTLPYYQNEFGYKKGDFPNAELYYAGEVSIPMYHNMAKEDLEYIIKTVNEF